jgi:ankyrin repeat protein
MNLNAAALNSSMSLLTCVLLLSGCNQDARLLDREVVELVATGTRDEVTTYFAKNPESVNNADGFGYYPIHIAASLGRADIIEVLLKSGANVNACAGADGPIALHMAVERSCSACVRLLLKGGADPNKKAANGLTALERAKIIGETTVLREFELNTNSSSAQ